MASAFLRGLKDLAGMTRTTGRVTGSLLSAPLREGNAIGAFARANPARSSIMGLGGALAIGGAGLAGLGPGSFIGDETARYITSKYGDTEESQNLITQTKLFGGTAAAAGLGFIGAGALMKEPTGQFLKSAYKKSEAFLKSGYENTGNLLKSGYKSLKNAPRYTQGFAKGIFSSDAENIVSRIDERLKGIADKRARKNIANKKVRKRTANRYFKNLKEKDAYRSGLVDAQKLKKGISRSIKNFYTKPATGGQKIADFTGDLIERIGRLDPLNAPDKFLDLSMKTVDTGFRYAQAGTRYAQKKIGSPVSFAKKHPFMTATAAGFTAGAIMAVETAGLERNAMGGFEGNIIDMGASSGGSISPELQFSTQGLVFALHKNNKNSRSRYQ